MKFLSGVVAVAVLAAQGVAGPVKTWKDDPAHSSIEFGVTHMVIAEVRGEFKQFEASVTAGRMMGAWPKIIDNTKPMAMTWTMAS